MKKNMILEKKISIAESMQKAPWVRGHGYWIGGERYFIDIWDEKHCNTVGRIGEPEEPKDSIAYTQCECNASAVVLAVNNTYGNGIDPESVRDLYEALKELLDWAKSIEGTDVSFGITNTPNSIFTQAKAAINKAELRK